MQMLSNRIKAVQTPIIPTVGDLIAANPGTISLGQGVVYYDPPDSVFSAPAKFNSDPENFRYQFVEGIPELRASIRHKLIGDNKIQNRLNEVVVTAGSNMGFLNAILAICDPDDEVILIRPWYFNHEMAIRMVNCIPVSVDSNEDYQPDLTALEEAITNRTRAIVTVSPNNPTGVVYTQENLTAVNNLCRQRGIFHISDEAYEYFCHDGAEHFSAASLDDAASHTISLFSLSKSYSLASWRMGYMVVPEQMFLAIRKIQDTNVICPPVISQYAALECLKAGSSYCAPMIEGLDSVRKYFLGGLKTISSVDHCSPTGAFYVFFRINDSNLKDMQVVQKLIQDYGVATVPGQAFGMENGCFIRASYGALEPTVAKKGIDRLIEGLTALIG